MAILIIRFPKILFALQDEPKTTLLVGRWFKWLNPYKNINVSSHNCDFLVGYTLVACLLEIIGECAMRSTICSRRRYKLC